MDTISITAHFDGERILLDEPIELEPNTKLIVTVLPKNDANINHGCVWLVRDLKMLMGKMRKNIR
jgi:hypothetical protein